MRSLDEILTAQKEVGNINISRGDYVFATTVPNPDPSNLWRVGYIDKIDVINGVHVIYLKDYDYPFGYAQRISDTEGHLVLTTFPV